MRPVLEQQIVDMDAPQLDPAVQQKIELGQSLSEAIDLYKARKELSDVASVIAAQSLSDRLSPHQFKRLLKQQQDTLHLDQRKKYYRESDPTKIYQGISYEIIRKLILSDPTIASSLNIGCNYAYMDWLLAKQFENVVFRAVDVNPDLVEINSDLKLPNTEFYSGYALELIESGQLTSRRRLYVVRLDRDTECGVADLSETDRATGKVLPHQRTDLGAAWGRNHRSKDGSPARTRCRPTFSVSR